MPDTHKIVAPLLVVVVAVVMMTIGPSAFFLDGDDASAPATSVLIDGLPFPGDVAVAGSKQLLIGGGTRSKWGVRVYGVGIYGDHKLCKSLQLEHSSGTVTVSALSRQFRESTRMRTVLLRFRRAVASSDVSEALREALLNKVGKEPSAKFSSFILGMVGNARLEKGAELFLSCKGETVRASLAEGGASHTLSIKGLCTAIFEVYLGDNPVSPQAKEGFEKGIANLVVSGKKS